MPKFFGTPAGTHVGQLFTNRWELHEAHLHAPTQAGISGTKSDGADSIVLSGGYPDEDFGDYIIYTGHGGRAPGSNKQTFDQSPEDSGNAGLITSMVQGLPVRVIRGAKLRSKYSPPVGFVYGGLFSVVETWSIRGKEGYLLVQFRLERLPEQDPLVTPTLPETDPAYAPTTVTRRIRDTALSRSVKLLYGHACQICGIRIDGVGGRFYSEGAHVRPLGRPHDGPDSFENLLCLCPNHHSSLDLGGIVILDDFSVASTSTLTPFGELTFRKRHFLDAANVRYQREWWLALLA